MAIRSHFFIGEKLSFPNQLPFLKKKSPAEWARDIEFLEERFPQQALIPQDALHRAHVRSLAQTIACDLHPLNNLRVMRYLSRPLELDAGTRSDWYNHWVTEGLKAYEKRLDGLRLFRKRQGLPPSIYSWGDRLGLADCCLIP